MPGYTIPQEQFSAHALSPSECARLLHRLGGPDPDPAAPPEQRLEAAGYTAHAAWMRLRDVLDPDLMVISAILAGRLKRLPPDPRLNPKPLPPAGPTRPQLDIVPGRAPIVPRSPRADKPLWTDPRAVLVSKIPNPRKLGTKAHKIFETYEVGLTVAELRARGLTATDLQWDGSRQSITFELKD